MNSRFITETDPKDLHLDKRIKLLNHLSFLCFVVIVFYIILDQIYETHIQLIVFVSIILSGAGTYLLSRAKKYFIAKLYGLLTFNASIYLVASSESSGTGVFLYFGVAGLSTIVLFGYEDRFKSYFFITLSALLYIFSQLSDFSILEKRYFSPAQTTAFFILNVGVCSYIAAYVLIMLMRMNYKTEEELRHNNSVKQKQNEDLTKANLELDRFVYSASHDLRAPLSSILGLIEICERSDDPEEIKQCLALMRRSIRNMDEFTKEIISYSRNARQELKEEPVVLYDLVTEVVEDLQFVTGAEEIYVKYNIDKELSFLIDKSRLKAILNNLIGNSIKYHDPQKEDQFIAVEAKREDSNITIEVADNGSGIPEEHVDKIFNMFYRASDSSRGSGLGLYIVKEVVQKMNGQISVVSEYRKGSTFRVTLPAKVLATAQAPA